MGQTGWVRRKQKVPRCSLSLALLERGKGNDRMVSFKGHKSGISCSKCNWTFFFGRQGFCEALTGSSGSLLSQSCVGKQNYLSLHCRVPGSPPDPASVKASGKTPA